MSRGYAPPAADDDLLWAVNPPAAPAGAEALENTEAAEGVEAPAELEVPAELEGLFGEEAPAIDFSLARKRAALEKMLARAQRLRQKINKAA